jgi:hypothetical protein
MPAKCIALFSSWWHAQNKGDTTYTKFFKRSTYLELRNEDREKGGAKTNFLNWRI